MTAVNHTPGIAPASTAATSIEETGSYSHLYEDEIHTFFQEYARLWAVAPDQRSGTGPTAPRPNFFQMHQLAHAYSTLPPETISLLSIAQKQIATATTHRDFSTARIILNLHTILNPDESIFVIFYKAICRFACQEWIHTNLLLTDFPNLSEQITVFKRDCSILPESSCARLLTRLEKYAKKWARAQEKGADPTNYPYNRSIHPIYAGPGQILESRKKKQELDPSIYPRYV